MTSTNTNTSDTMLDTEKTDKDAKPRRRRGPFSSSYFWAFVFAAAIAGWMLSGELIIGGKSTAGANDTAIADKTGTAKDAAGEKEKFRVRVRTFHAVPRQASLTLRGRTEADARVKVRAETAGLVQAIPAEKGDTVEKGTLLCRIETGAREANLLEAKAAFAQADADYEAAVRLAKRGHTAKLKVAEFQAKRDAARAAIARAELDLRRTEITAPFRGIIEEQPAKTGDYLSVGGACATLVAVDPLIIVGAVAERDVVALSPGMQARATLVTGEKVEGPLRFISPASDTSTRTFRIEMEVKNPGLRLKDGVTADISIPLQSTKAHRFSPAILSLDDEGRIGVRAVEHGDTVKFLPVTILADGEDGLWVAGLPDHVTVITVGQDYVVDGQKVIAVEENTAKSS